MKNRALFAAARSPLLCRMGWSSLGQGLTLGAQLLLTPVLLSALGPDRFGAWAFVGVLISVMTSIDGGTSAACWFFLAGHRASGDRSAASRLLVTVTAIHLVVGGLLTIASARWLPVAARWLDTPTSIDNEVSALRWLVGPMITSGVLLAVFTSLLQAHDDFRSLGYITAIRNVVMVVGTLGVTLGGASLRSLAVVQLSSSVAALMCGAAAGRRYVPVIGSRLLDRSEWRALCAYAWRMQASGLTVLANVRLDALIVGFLLPVRAVGTYVIAANVAAGVRAIPLFALPPVFTHLAVRHAQGGLAAAAQAYRSLNARWIVGSVGYATVGVVSIGFGVRAWLGADQIQAAHVAAIIFAGHGVNLLTGVASTFARAIGRPGLETRYAVCCTLINLVLTVPLAWRYGLAGIVTASSVGAVVGSLYFFSVLRRSVSEDLGRFGSGFRPGITAGVVLGVLGAQAGLSGGGLVGTEALAASGMVASAGFAAFAWFHREELLGFGGRRRMVAA